MFASRQRCSTNIDVTSARRLLNFGPESNQYICTHHRGTWQILNLVPMRTLILSYLKWPRISQLQPGVVSNQCKRAIVTPVPKVSKPMQPSDFRPISITPVLSRSFEKYMVMSYIYPTLQEPTSGLYFADQFGFRPTGSTTTALIALFHTILTSLCCQLIHSSSHWNGLFKGV